MPKDLKFSILGDPSDAQRAFKQVQAAAEDTMRGVGVATAGAVATLALIEGAVISTSAEFERFKTQLETIEGSSSKAQQSMDWITEFAKDTPYELAGITDAFVTLKAYGIDPVDGTLATLGDTAAAMGKPLKQGVEALADAMTGEFERLKEFGIKAKVVGDQVSFAYTQNGEQMTATADKNSQQMIQATLQGIWNDKYAGGMEKLAGTWDGMTSNLGDNWTLFQKQIGDEGAFLAAKNVLGVVLEELGKNDEAVKELAGDISDVLITSMQVGVTAASVFGKGIAALQMPIDAVRIGIDSLALGAVQGFDLMLAGTEEIFGVLEMLPGELGAGYAKSKVELQGFRKEISHLEQGILETGNVSVNTFLDNSVEIEKQWAGIDKNAQKVFDALEKGRGAADAALAPGGKPETGGKGGNNNGKADGAAAKALADAQKVIDIHSAKFQRMTSLGESFGLSEADRLLAANDLDLQLLNDEQQRMEQAALAQGASAENRAALDAYYDELKINRAQETSDAITAIEVAQDEARMQRLMDGQQAAYDMKGQFNQLFNDQQQIHLGALAGNIGAYSKAAADWEKWTGDQKLGFAASTFGALSGLMASENKKQFEIGKKAARAENAINTYLGATKAVQAFAGLGPIGVGLGFAAAAVIVGAGMANDSKISSAQMGSGTSGGVTMPTSSAGGGGATSTIATNPTTGLATRDVSSTTTNTATHNWNITITDAQGDPQAIAESLMPYLEDAANRGFGSAPT